MDTLLRQKYETLQNAEDFECWYLVKQPTEFSSICYLVSILERYQNEHSSDVFQTYVESKIANINRERHLDISSNYRALRIAAFYGLIKMVSSSYQDSILTETYYEIKARCGGAFENISTYSDIIQRQIEKMYASTSIDEKFDSVRRNFRLYPVFFLYKILLEIGYATNNYSISMDEYRYLVATSTTYNKFLETLLLIQKWRDASDADRNLFNPFRAKFDNRFIQALKQLTTLNVDTSSSITLKRECVSEVAQKVFSFEKYLRNERFDDAKFVDFLCSKEWLVDEKTDGNQNADEENLSDEETKELPQIETPEQYKESPVQIIYYGVPGSGKSFLVEEEINKKIAAYNKDKEKTKQITYEKQVVRTVFHPDYCNADFVGQVMPKKGRDGEFKYVFKPGPFSTIVRKAYLNPTKPYFLVIEEINRGNAAGIFGEMFQLLDRFKDGECSKKDEVQSENYNYTKGWSRYSINNDDVNDFILLGGESNIVEKEPGVEYDSDFSEGPHAAIKIPSINLHFSIYCGVRLPPNLSLYATMNTSDQNVFTLDNAFQRRWEMKQVSNKLKDSLPENVTDEQKKNIEAEISQYNELIGDTNVKWGVFRDEINKIIMKSAEENGLSSMEDKRLGGWFVVPKKPDEEGDSKAAITKEAFAEKVLKYLWDDAFKFDRPAHFGKVLTLEKLIENFKKDGFSVFVDAEIKKLQEKGSDPE